MLCPLEKAMNGVLDNISFSAWAKLWLKILLSLRDLCCDDLRKYWKQSFHHYWQYQELLIHDMILLPIFLTCQRHCKVLIGCKNELENLWNYQNYSDTKNFICLSYFITRKMKNLQELKGSMLNFKCLAFKVGIKCLIHLIRLVNFKCLAFKGE